ncbi:hypothetical protein Hanom_Chr05g00417731 [Helianthus anomalus]
MTRVAQCSWVGALFMCSTTHGLRQASTKHCREHIMKADQNGISIRQMKEKILHIVLEQLP